MTKCGRKSSGGTYTCTKHKGHVRDGDPTHSNGRVTWGKWW